MESDEEQGEIKAANLLKDEKFLSVVEELKKRGHHWLSFRYVFITFLIQMHLNRIAWSTKRAVKRGRKFEKKIQRLNKIYQKIGTEIQVAIEMEEIRNL